MPKRANDHFVAALIACLLIWNGCGILFHPGLLFGGDENKANPDVYHVGKHEWVGDSIYVHVFKTSEPSATPSLPKITAECKSCNRTNDPLPLTFDASGVAHIYIPEARQLLSARIRLSGNGIDTTFIQTQRPPDEATSYFHLTSPLVGRVMIEHLALLYLDSTQDSVVATANVGDELNIYNGGAHFYSVQDPNFEQPLYLLKLDAFRLE